jgi:hypothetical protein
MAYLYNHISNKSLDWRKVMQHLTGETLDISILMQFTFWEEVFFMPVNTSFPSKSTEERGYFVGLVANVCDLMTFQVLSTTTQKILMRSNVRSVVSSGCPNSRLSTDGEVDSEDFLSNTLPSKSCIQSEYDNRTGPDSPYVPNLPGFLPYDLIGRSFLGTPRENGTQHWVRITKAIADNLDNLEQHPDKVKFLIDSPTGHYEKILTYNEVLKFHNIDEDHNIEQDNGTLTKFKDIVGHVGPLRQQEEHYMGSKYNVQVEWEDGDVTDIPLNIWPHTTLFLARYMLSAMICCT